MSRLLVLVLLVSVAVVVVTRSHTFAGFKSSGLTTDSISKLHNDQGEQDGYDMTEYIGIPTYERSCSDQGVSNFHDNPPTAEYGTPDSSYASEPHHLGENFHAEFSYTIDDGGVNWIYTKTSDRHMESLGKNINCLMAALSALPLLRPAEGTGIAAYRHSPGNNRSCVQLLRDVIFMDGFVSSMSSYDAVLLHPDHDFLHAHAILIRMDAATVGKSVDEAEVVYETRY